MKSVLLSSILLALLSIRKVVECDAFSLPGLSKPNPRHLLIQELQTSQSKKDTSIEKWYKSQGIFGTSQICLCTSQKSVGGRGLFWVSGENAEQGDVLALIPSHCVITKSNFCEQYPELESMEDSGAPWQAKIATYSRYCLHPPEGNDNRDEWVKSWYGGGPGAPRPFDSYSSQELNDLMSISEASLDFVEEAIDARYNTFLKDFKSVNEYNKDIAQFGDLYSIVLSRTANLGPEWENRRGIIPFHDMVNHPPLAEVSNVELFAFGDIRKMIGYVHANELVKQLVTRNAESNTDDGGKKRLFCEPKDSDMLLVASREIEPGMELWLSYNSRGEMEDEKKLGLMLQYGFPFHM